MISGSALRTCLIRAVCGARVRLPSPGNLPTMSPEAEKGVIFSYGIISFVCWRRTGGLSGIFIPYQYQTTPRICKAYTFSRFHPTKHPRLSSVGRYRAPECTRPPSSGRPSAPRKAPSSPAVRNDGAGYYERGGGRVYRQAEIRGVTQAGGVYTVLSRQSQTVNKCVVNK